MTASLLLALVLLLAAAKLGGAVAERLGQPAVLGELLAGILLASVAFTFLAVLIHKKRRMSA